jgi:uracil permease
MTIGLSGAKLSVGSVTVQGMVLATLIAMALSMMFKLFEHCGLMRKD